MLIKKLNKETTTAIRKNLLKWLTFKTEFS